MSGLVLTNGLGETGRRARRSQAKIDRRIQAPPVTALTADVNAHPGTRSVLVIAVLSGIAVACALLRPVHAVNPGARAALETTIALSATFSAGLLIARLGRRRQVPDLLLLCALLAALFADLVYCAAPALSGGVGLESGGGARLVCELLVSLAFAAAAFAPRRTIPDPSRRWVTSIVVAGAGTLMLGELLAQLISSRWVSGGIAGNASHPVVVGVHVAAAAVLIVAALAFVARSRRGGLDGGLLAGASFLLGGASLQYLAMPVPATDWVTPREGLRLAAYALLLAGAYARYAKIRRDEARAAIGSERERIARDLHDGLVQDLACIAAQGQRLDSNLGPEHPLMVATRHALATSRGTIADLWASTAPSTEAALRLIAGELEHRYDVEVQVLIEADTALTADNDLEPSQREHLVRIAREAIVNAALHGTARHVDVVLVRRGRDLLLRVSDDGRGITDTERTGFGLRTMRARAASLGGQLSAHPRADGGTELELVVR
jgi:signal transduction histidine kinase